MTLHRIFPNSLWNTKSGVLLAVRLRELGFNYILYFYSGKLFEILPNIIYFTDSTILSELGP